MSQTKKKMNHKWSRDYWFVPNIILRVIYSLTLVGISFLLISGAFAAGIGAGYFAYLVEDTKMPTKVELQKDLGDLTQTSKLVYSDNKQIATIRSDLLRTNIKSDQISDWLKKAIISTEDEYFYEHNGMVPKAVLRALLSEVTGLGSSGGSTLTQQLVKQQLLTNEQTFKRKANEILYAMEIERNFSKEEILTMYLNISSFGRNNRGQNIAGVQEAARGIFGVSAAKLSLPQAAFIAGLPQSPIVYSPFTNTGELKEEKYLAYGLERKDYVLFSMYRNHEITKKEYQAAKAYDLVKDFKKPQSAGANTQGFLYNAVMDEAIEIVAKKLADEKKVSDEEYANDEVRFRYFEIAEQKLANGGYTVKTTIDRQVYQAMQQAVATYGYMLNNWSGATIEVGNVLMENSTGKILGFVGGRNYQKNQYNHAFSSKRQAGSAIKPVLVYAPAIDQGLVGTETKVADYPTSWQGGEDAGNPILNATNSGSKTFISIREALVRSENIPATHLYQNTIKTMGNPEYVYDTYLKKMNYPQTSVWQYETAPLGVMEISTLAQTNGFQTLANHGVYQKGYMVEAIIDSNGEDYYRHEENPIVVYSKATASIMMDLMRSAIDRGYTSQFKANLQSIDWSLADADWVGKTGTTNEYVDNWLVVSTPNITLSSWSGREDNKPSDAGSSERTALYMAYLTNAIYQANPEIIGADKRFKLDPSVKKYTVSTFTGTKIAETVDINNRTLKMPNETVTSYWAKNGPTNPTFKFGIGGTTANYESYWNRLSPKVEEKDDEKDKDTDKDEDEDKDKDDKKPENSTDKNNDRDSSKKEN